MGLGTLICVASSENVTKETMERILSEACVEARRMRLNSIKVVVMASNLAKAFRYGELFTKHVDIGIRLFVEQDINAATKLLEGCELVCAPQGDVVVREILERLPATTTRRFLPP